MGLAGITRDAYTVISWISFRRWHDENILFLTIVNCPQDFGMRDGDCLEGSQGISRHGAQLKQVSGLQSIFSSGLLCTTQIPINIVRISLHRPWGKGCVCVWGGGGRLRTVKKSGSNYFSWFIGFIGYLAFLIEKKFVLLPHLYGNMRVHTVLNNTVIWICCVGYNERQSYDVDFIWVRDMSFSRRSKFRCRSSG